MPPLDRQSDVRARGRRRPSSVRRLLSGPPPRGAFLDTAERLLDTLAARSVLSVLILLSVIPPSVLAEVLPAALVRVLDPFLLLVFSAELAVRVALYRRRWRRRRAGRWEPLVLLLDLVAVATFLPLDALFGVRELRLLRLTRLLLLVSRWGGMLRDLWDILSGPERRTQVVTVILLGALLALASSVVLVNLSPSYDFDGDGASEQQGFFEALWWSFRQVQDPGNLVARPDGLLVVTLSLLLTFSGLLLFSFVVGIGTGAVEELLHRSQARPVRLQGHTVILGLPPFSRLLVEELVEIYRKNLRRFRGAVLAVPTETPDFLLQPQLRSFRYRSGHPENPSDLVRVRLEAARRALVLGGDPVDPDAEVIATVLAARNLAPSVPLYPDVEHERNFAALRAAGGPATHVVGSGSFLGHYIVQNLVFPGSHRLFRQLLRSRGCEIYTYLYPEEELEAFRSLASGPGSRGPRTIDPRALWETAWREWGVNLLGVFVVPRGTDADAPLEQDDLDVLLNPMGRPWGERGAPGEHRTAHAVDDAGRLEVRWIRGLVGIGLRWEGLRGFAQFLAGAGELATALTVGSGADGEGAALEGLELAPPAGPVRRAVVCGESPRLPRVVQELVGWFGAPEIAVVVREPERIEDLAWGVANRLGAPLEEGPGGAMEVRCPSGARVTFLGLDWTDVRRLLERPDLGFAEADAVLFLPGSHRGEVLDGSVALDCLHLAELDGEQGTAPDGEAPFGRRVFAMVRDPVKGRRLERRLERFTDRHGTPRYTVVSSERVRHDYIVQNVFVRALNTVYLHLLNAEGQSLARLVPVRRPEGTDGEEATFDPFELARHLLDHRGWLLVGLELPGWDGEDDEDQAPAPIEARGGPSPFGLRALLGRGPGDGAGTGTAPADGLILDPLQLAPGTRLPWDAVQAVYCLGHGGDFFA